MLRDQPWQPPGEYAPEGWMPYSEADKVEEWRTKQLVRAGVPEVDAKVLARSKSDLHTMVEAAEAGLSRQGMLAIFV